MIRSNTGFFWVQPTSQSEVAAAGAMASHPALAFILLFSATLASGCNGGKVLVYPVDGSHWLNMKIMVEALHSRGHEVTVVRSSTSWYVAEFSPHYTSITVHQDEPQNLESQSFMTSFLKKSLDIRRRQGSPWAFVEFYRNLFEMIGDNQVSVANFIVTIFEDKKLMQKLRDTGFDFCLTDPAFPGGVLLAHHLQLPLVLNVRWIFNGDVHFALAPSPLSYIPQLFSESSDKMDLFQRLKNVIYHNILMYMYFSVSNPPYQAVCDKYFGQGVNVMSLIQGADLVLMRVDFTFEFPRPTMPNVIYIGGFQGKAPKPLPSHLEDFVQSSGEHGVVVMTLGTLLNDLGPEISETIASAFANIPQKVVWRHTGKRPATLGNNTMLLEWLPQNDLLGHAKTKVFVTHGGTNGIYEAIYQSVPILGIPLIFDQYDNMVRLKARGVAEMVEVTKMDVESLTSALRNILDPQKPYKQNMVKLSELHRDKPIKPLDNAVFWMEFVMRHQGAAHLRTESYKLPWYSYHCLDVMAVMVAFVVIISALVWVCCRCVIRRCLRTKTSSSKSKRE